MISTSSVKAIIFDFGGVISRTLFETHAQPEATLGLAPNSLTWLGPFNTETDPLWREMQADANPDNPLAALSATGDFGQLPGCQAANQDDCQQ